MSENISYFNIIFYFLLHPSIIIPPPRSLILDLFELALQEFLLRGAEAIVAQLLDVLPDLRLVHPQPEA